MYKLSSNKSVCYGLTIVQICFLITTYSTIFSYRLSTRLVLDAEKNEGDREESKNANSKK